MKLSVDSVKEIAKTVLKTAEDHSSEILIAIGIGGMATSAVLAVTATPKALKKIEADEAKTKKEVIKSCWKFYIPSLAVFVGSAACIIGAERINLQKNAALATAYTLTDTFAKEYKEVVNDTVTDKQNAEIREKVAKNRMKDHPLIKEDIPTEDGSAIFYEPYSNRYFPSSMARMQKIDNELNRLLIDENYISLNDFYYKAGLPTCKLGDQLGWDYGKGVVHFRYTPALSEEIDDAGNQIPVLSIDFTVDPSPLW